MKRQFMGAVAATALAAMAGAAAAQESAGEAAAPAGGTTLDPITIFATLSPLAAFDFPGEVSVVDREEIQTRQAHSFGDIVKDVPGVFLDGGARRSGQAPTIRGFREEDILILVDGVKQSFISGHDGRIFVEPDLLKTVEIVKGPMSALYGSGALGGVLALTTVDAADFLDPGETAGVRLKAGYQSGNDEYTLTSTSFMRTKDGKFDALASFTYRNAGDIELGNDTTLPEQEKIAASLLKATTQLSEDMKFTGTWVHYQNDALNPNDPQGNSTGDLVNRFTQSDTVSGKFSYTPAGNPLIDGNLLVYWAQHSNKEADLIDPRVTDRNIETVGVNADNRSRFQLNENTKLTLTYGAEYYVDTQTSTDNAPIGGGLNNVPDAAASYYGAFMQAEFKIGSPLGLPGELTVLPGVRWDGFANDYKGTAGYGDFEDQAISKKLGLAYKPVPWFLLFGNYGEAFRAPSYTELYAQGNHFQLFPGAPFNQFRANPFLRPQDGVTVEGGLGFDFRDVAQRGDRLTIKGSYWKTKADDFIDLDVIVTNGCIFPGGGDCYSQFNNKNAKLHGTEVEVKYDASGWYASGAFTHIDGVDTDTGLYLGVLQPDKLVFDTGLKLPEMWTRVGTRVTFADKMTKVNDPAEIRDAYSLIDVYAVIEPAEGPLKGFRLDFGIDNIMDTDYAVIAAGAFEEGVNFKAALSWTQKW